MVDKLEIRVFGKVQGVGFRYNVVNYAREAELTGYAKNLEDGTVKIFAEGKKASLLSLVDFIKNSPGASDVSNVDLEWQDSENRTYSVFRIRF